MNYYRSGGGGWGTNQYQFPAPLAPKFQPQPSWGGMDYFRAHADSPDMSLYNHAWDRVRDYSGSGGIGVGQSEAKHWHRRAYGGLGNPSQMLPEELGHAAAYEAYRTWKHNSFMYEPLSGDLERQREALIGLAIAEATRLLAYSGRSRDSYCRTEASEAAAATASVIFAQSRTMDMDGGYRSRSRAGSFSGAYDGSYRNTSPYRSTSPFPGGGTSSAYGDPYAYDEPIMHRHRSHSRSRRHSSSSHHRPIIVTSAPQYGAGYGTNPVAIPGSPVASSSYGTYSSYGGYGGASPYGQPLAAPVPMYTGSSMPSYGGGYAGSNVAPGALVVPSSRSHRHSFSGSHRPRSASGYSYGY